MSDAFGLLPIIATIFLSHVDAVHYKPSYVGAVDYKLCSTLLIFVPVNVISTKCPHLVKLINCHFNTYISDTQVYTYT
jgi:hypothetical protein